MNGYDGLMVEDDDETVDVLTWQRGDVRARRDSVAKEEPLEIRIRGRAISVTMRTPGHDQELAAGFLVTEGLVGRREDLLSIDPCDRNEFGNVVNARLGPMVSVDFERLTRHLFASSSCGLCGKATIDAVCIKTPRLDDDTLVLRAEDVCGFPERLRRQQAQFERTGGLHAAGLFCGSSGELLVCREDVGRHNAVDKVIGRAFLDGHMPLRRHVLMVSGRVSFEIMQKALAARIPIIAAVSAPTSLAVRFARDSGQTLIGFIRDQRLNVYAHPQRVAFTSATDAAHDMNLRSRS